MQTIKHKQRIGRVLVLAFITVSGIVSSVFSQTNIEKNFTRANNIDLSGSYEISGLLPDSSEYHGSVKVEKWNTLTTPQGNVLQLFKTAIQYGESKSSGIAVFDGHRLYYASGEGKHDNFYLMLLSKLEFSQEEHSSLFNYKEGNRAAEKNHYVAWKDKAPWYGYLELDHQAYGYWFWIDGVWGQYATNKNGFPPSSDTGNFFMLELKKDGDFGKRSGIFYPDGFKEFGWINTTPEGENLRIDVSWNSGSKKKETWGAGMLTPHPMTGDTILVAMIGGPENTSYGFLEISGNKLVGRSSWQGSEGRCIEEWAVPDDVIKKNPAWFK